MNDTDITTPSPSPRPHDTRLLSQLQPGQSGIITDIEAHGAFRKRLLEMGFTRGRQVTVLRTAPTGDPVIYKVMDYDVSLRKAEAAMIEVAPEDAIAAADTKSKAADNPTTASYTQHSHPITVALVGNPNCGKTSLYNAVSHSSEHTGNYAGVTVDVKQTTFEHNGYIIHLVDLPGTYSLSSYSPEEVYVRQYLREQVPDVIVDVVDATNLERNLFLTTQLIDMDRRMVIALNMYDELRASGSVLDYKMLGRMLGVPIVPTVSKTGEGLPELLDTVIRVYEDQHEDVRHVHVKLDADMEAAVTRLKDALKDTPGVDLHFSPRYIAIKLLEGDAQAEHLIADSPDKDRILALRDSLIRPIVERDGQDASAIIAGEKYGFIAGALEETLKRQQSPSGLTTQIIDSVALSRRWGFGVFVAVMVFTFWATFSLGQYPMDWLDWIVNRLGELASWALPEGPVRGLIADGIIGGVGAVIVFLPNILILYYCISFMEDSGYMARAAFIMDSFMHRIGLHGKSFIPLIMGFGCSVPAIMATRSIESRTSRIITAVITPFMSCSARLPIYVLLIGTFFPSSAIVVFCSVYLLGILAAIGTALLLRHTRYKKDETPFVMELPPYRMPTGRSLWRHTKAKAGEYLKKMGGVVLVGAIVIWVLNYFPTHDRGQGARPGDSYLAQVGKAITPIMEPIGMNWQTTVSAIAGLPAKEIVVSTLGVLYTGNEEAMDATLGQKMRSATPRPGHAPFGTAAALGFMVFILLYSPCLASVAAIWREAGPGWAIFSVVYNTLLAWGVGWITYRIALLL